MLLRIHLAALLVVGLSCSPAAGQVVMYTITDLGSLGGASEAFAISQNGQITGISDLPGDQAGHAFRIPLGGHIGDPGTDLGTLGGANSAGFGINNAGQVTGQGQLANSAYHAFRTSPGGKISDPGTDRGTYGGLYSIGYGINASGQVTLGAGDHVPGRTRRRGQAPHRTPLLPQGRDETARAGDRRFAAADVRARRRRRGPHPADPRPLRPAPDRATTGNATTH